jgi:hypothetical protein
MKRFTATSGRKAAANPRKTTATTTEPFAENRYRKFRFQRESVVLEAPESSGVYGLYSALWIFIGEADNIRARLLEHLADEDSCINRRQPSGFAFELVSPEDRSHRRAELVDELEPTCMDEPPHIQPVRSAVPVGRSSVEGLARYTTK